MTTSNAATLPPPALPDPAKYIFLQNGGFFAEKFVVAIFNKKHASWPANYCNLLAKTFATTLAAPCGWKIREKATENRTRTQ